MSAPPSLQTAADWEALGLPVPTFCSVTTDGHEMMGWTGVAAERAQAAGPVAILGVLGWTFVR